MRLIWRCRFIIAKWESHQMDNHGGALLRTQLAQPACEFPTGIAVKPSNVLPQDGPVVIQTYLVQLTFTGHLVEEDLYVGGHKHPHGYPNDLVNSQINGAYETIIIHAANVVFRS